MLLARDGRPEAVKFIKGDDALRSMTERLRAAKYDVVTPDDTPVKLLRRGTVSCANGSAPCQFVLMLPADAQTLQQK